MKKLALSLKYFGQTFGDSAREVRGHFGRYIKAYTGLVLVAFLSLIPWEIFFPEKHETFEIASSAIGGFMSLIFIVDVVLVEKARTNSRPKEELLYAIPTYFISTFYSLLFILAGLFLFVIPGVIAAVFVAMAPLGSLLLENSSTHYLKVSFEMGKKNFLPLLWLVLASLGAEGLGLLFDSIPHFGLRTVANIAYALAEAFFMVVLTVVSVKFFYRFEKDLLEKSETLPPSAHN